MQEDFPTGRRIVPSARFTKECALVFEAHIKANFAGKCLVDKSTVLDDVSTHVAFYGDTREVLLIKPVTVYKCNSNVN